jgi:DNA-binding HxlR family transcriptional regulator
MEKEQKPDEYCDKIFAVLSMTNEKIRFNELHRKLRKLGAPMTKPTLIEHLKHLEKKEIIQRDQEEKQKVTYSLNWKKFKQIQKAKEINQTLLSKIENEQRFKSKSLNQQVIYVTTALTTAELFYLRTVILGNTEPQNKLEHYLTYTIIRRLFNTYATWLYDTCKESEENAQKIIKLVDRRIREFEKLLFELRPELAQQKGSLEPNSLLDIE